MVKEEEVCCLCLKDKEVIKNRILIHFELVVVVAVVKAIVAGVVKVVQVVIKIMQMMLWLNK